MRQIAFQLFYYLTYQVLKTRKVFGPQITMARNADDQRKFFLFFFFALFFFLPPSFFFFYFFFFFFVFLGTPPFFVRLFNIPNPKK